MQQHVKMKFCFFLFLFLIIFSTGIEAVSMSTSGFNQQFDFTPNKIIEKTYNVRCDPEKLAVLKLDGRLSEFAEVDPESALGGGKFKVKINLPSSLEGGLHVLKICATETNEGFVNVVFGACDLIYVHSLFEGKHLQDWTFSISNVDLTDREIIFTVVPNNWGKENINFAYAAIDVYDTNDQLVKTLQTETKPIPSAGTANLEASMENNLEPGNYWAEAELIWDEGKETKNTSFNVGSSIIKISNISTNFYANEINLVNIYLKSGFKGKTEGIYLTLEAGDDLIESPTFDLNPFETKKISLAWDTNGLETKDYRARVIIYQDNSELSREEFTFSVEERKKPVNLTLIVGLTIVIAIILGLTIFYASKQRKKQFLEPNY